MLIKDLMIDNIHAKEILEKLKSIKDICTNLGQYSIPNKQTPMKLVIIESPFAGNIKENIKYAKLCVRNSLLKGESPIASHLLYTQEGILNDDIPDERKLGIDAGLAWKRVANIHAFYIDKGISQGMKYAMKYSTQNNIPIEFRSILLRSKINTL